MAINYDQQQFTSKQYNASNHMANERTFLAWIRTSIGIMAFGFVVERFSLFLTQLSEVLGKEPGFPVGLQSSFRETSSIYGIFLVALGAFICLLASIKYKQVEKQLDEGNYHPSRLLDVMLTLSVLSIGISLFIYLIHSI
jgi:inner membrane protein YidH